MDRYYVVAPLGEGGVSEVFLGYDLGDPRFVALKVLKEAFRDNAGALGRMRREAEIYEAMRHPSVVGVLGSGPVADAGFFMAQEYLRGVSLQDALEEAGGPLPVNRAVALLEDLAGGLKAAHDQGFIHRDVKPENVILGPDGRFTLLDFGMAKAEDEHVRTELGTVMGTMAYAPPEQRRGRPVDHRSDVFALGAVAYEALTGRRAVNARTFQEMMDASTRDLPRPSEVRPEVPEILDLFCTKLMDDDPDRRYQDLGELVQQLGGLRKLSEGDEAEALFGDPVARRIEDAIRALRAGRPRKAAEALGDLATTPPPELRARIHHVRGMIMALAGDAERALAELEQALDNDADDGDVVLDTALLLLHMGRLGDARELLSHCSGSVRYSLLVLSLIDAIEAIPGAPPATWEAARRGERAAFSGSIRAGAVQAG